MMGCDSVVTTMGHIKEKCIQTVKMMWVKGNTSTGCVMKSETNI